MITLPEDSYLPIEREIEADSDYIDDLVFIALITNDMRGLALS